MILILSREPDQRVNLSLLLKAEGYEVLQAGNPELAMQQLLDNDVELIVYEDDELLAGQVFFDYLEANPLFHWIPVIVLVAAKDKAHHYLELGASDVLSQPVQSADFLLRIRTARQKSQTIENIAFRDPLTGVYNRRFFEMKMKQQLRRAGEQNRPISLSFIDADRFKSINDTFGHDVGDLVLQGMARLIQRHLRASDVLARFGGEEFVVLLSDSGAAEAYSLMQSILDSAHAEPVAVHGNDEKRFVTFSGGVCQWKPGMTAEQWIKRADEAAYQAKQQGRDQIVLSVETPRRKELPKTAVLLLDRRGKDATLGGLAISHRLKVTSAGTTDEARAILKRGPVELLIISLHHIEGDAFELLANVRKGTPEIRSILISDEASEKYVLNSLRVGADHYIQPPMGPLNLEMVVSQYLSDSAVLQ